ncbi:hypothetical protein ACWDTQ_28200 [Streptomyces cellulosae]
MPEISVTMKAHGGHDASWVVVKAESLGELTDILDGFQSSGVSALVGGAVTALRAEEALGAALGARPETHPGQYDNRPNSRPQSGSQPAGQATPYGTPPTCPHGTKRFLEKPYKNKPGTWRAWACPAPQGTPDACSLEFIK